jgi:hypothetical protein
VFISENLPSASNIKFEMAWERLIRFVDEHGEVCFGEPIIEKATDLTDLLAKKELYALKLKGDDPFELSGPGEKTHVAKLLGVLDPSHVPIIKCIGLNYMKHSTTRK